MKFYRGNTMSIFMDLVLLLIIIFLIIIVIQKCILKNDNINIFGYSVFYIKTGSMMPNLKVGDIVLVKVTKNITKGDIVIYKDKNNDFICHRLVEFQNDFFILKGDANNAEDEPITSSQIIGKVIIKIKK